MATEVINVIDPDQGAGWHYDSLGGWESNEQDDISVTTGTNEQHTAKCRCTGGTADSSCTFTGWTTEAPDNYIKVWTDPAESYRHNGTYQTGNKFRMEVDGPGANGILYILQDHVRIDGIQIKNPTTDKDSNLVRLATIGAGSDIRFSNCIVVGGNNALYYDNGFHMLDPDINISIWNCLVYGISSDADSRALWAGNTNTVKIYNSTFISGDSGIVRTAGTVTMKNCYVASGNGQAAYSGTITKTTCASSDATGSAGLQNIAYNTTQFVNVTPGSEDLHLPGAGSALYHTGTDTSGDAAPMNFTTDIDGDNYYDTGGVRSIGADEYVAGVPPSGFPFHKRGASLGFNLGMNRGMMTI